MLFTFDYAIELFELYNNGKGVIAAAKKLRKDTQTEFSVIGYAQCKAIVEAIAEGVHISHTDGDKVWVEIKL